MPMYVPDLDTGLVITDHFSNEDTLDCPHTFEILATDYSSLTSTQKLIVLEGQDEVQMESRYFNGENFQVILRINTAWDEPLVKTININKIPNFIEQVGVCQVTADGTQPTQTYDFGGDGAMNSRKECRDACVLKGDCKGYQWLPDQFNCYGFIETKSV